MSDDLRNRARFLVRDYTTFPSMDRDPEAFEALVMQLAAEQAVTSPEARDALHQAVSDSQEAALALDNVGALAGRGE